MSQASDAQPVARDLVFNGAATFPVIQNFAICRMNENEASFLARLIIPSTGYRIQRRIKFFCYTICTRLADRTRKSVTETVGVGHRVELLGCILIKQNN